MVDLLSAAVLLISAPLAVFPDRFDPAAVMIGLGLLVVPYLWRIGQGHRWSVATPVNGPLALLLGICIPISAYMSPYFWELTWPESVRMAWGIGLCLAVINWANPRFPADGSQSVSANQHRARRIWLTAAFLAVGVVLGLIGLFGIRALQRIPGVSELAVNMPMTARDLLSIPIGFHPNRVAGLLTLFAPLTVALFLASPWRSAWDRMGLGLWVVWKLLAGGLALFFCGALLLTQSRGGLLAFACSVAVVLGLAYRRGLLMILTLLILGAVVVAYIGPGQIVNRMTFHEDDLPTHASLFDKIRLDRNLTGRLAIWRHAVTELRAFPLSGVGMATFSRRYADEHPTERTIDHAHNFYLQTALDLGVLGLLAVLALFGSAARYLLLLYQKSTAGSLPRFWTVGMTGSLVGFLVYSITDAMPLGARPSVAVWYLIGLIVGVGAQESAHRSDILAR